MLSMDEETVKRIEPKIEELQRVEFATKDCLNTTDGFTHYIKKQLGKINRKFGWRSPDETKTPLKSSSVKCFEEIKTAFIPSEAKQGQTIKKVKDISPIDINVYEFNHTDRGLALIISNDFKNSKDHDRRPGSSYDVAALHHTFENLGFKVLVKENLTAHEMIKTLRTVKDHYNHADADCFVCSILTHGNEEIYNDVIERMGSLVRHDVLIGLDLMPVSTRRVVELFSDINCPGLQGKPRMFFFQACRGSKNDDGTQIIVTKPVSIPAFVCGKSNDKKDQSNYVDRHDQNTSTCQTSLASTVYTMEYNQRLIDSTDAKPYIATEEIVEFSNCNVSKASQNKPGVSRSEQHLSPLRDVPVCPTSLYKDCLVMYGTPPGHYSWRRDTGSWFIQSLCAVLNSPKIAHTPLMKALVIVSRQVAEKYESNTPDDPESHEKKEVPVIESMLVKDVYLR